MHVHAFSPLEVTQGAATLGLSLRDFLAQLKEAGLGTLPGTAAEILDDEVRAIICPDKINTAQWLDVVRTAHRLGLRTTSTIMYGHVERPISWARHLLRLRDLQAETGGFTEFVPLPFVHMEAPMYLRGQARKGPTLREAVLMHAVARLALHPLITNIQTSWVKMGPDGAALCLNAGANDLGGTLMNESISRAAGTQHGQEFPPEAMEELIRSIGRVPVQRDTLYRPARAGAARRVVRCAGTGAGGADAAAQGAGGGVAGQTPSPNPTPRTARARGSLRTARSLSRATRGGGLRDAASPTVSVRSVNARVAMRGAARMNAAHPPADRCPAQSPAASRSSARSPARAPPRDAAESCRRRTATASPSAASTAPHWTRVRHAPARW